MREKTFSPELQKQIAQLPKHAGVYHFLGKEGNLLYVGKAGNLRSRVQSYFRVSGKGLSKRIEMMVALIDKIEWVITANEQEALVLENSHIKEFKPKFNILFRDDKSYPYLRFSKEDFPRLSYYRSRHFNVINEKSALQNKDKCLGPYPDSLAVREAIAVLQKVFRIRTCADSIFKNRKRACLLHQIKRCSAPCVGKININDYQQTVNLAVKFVQGNQPEVFEELEQKMNNAAQDQKYEQAAEFRDQLQALRVTASAQRIVGEVRDNCDLIVCVLKDDYFAVSFRQIRAGMPSIESHSAHRNLYLAKPEEIIYEYLRHKYFNITEKPAIQNLQMLPNNPEKIWINIDPKDILSDSDIKKLPLALPKKTREKEWLARLINQSMIVLESEKNSRESANHSLIAVQELLNLNTLPTKIECIDVSHFSGEGTTASWVVFVEGKSAGNLYRRYTIRAKTNGDDYLAITELITRRYAKLAKDEDEINVTEQQNLQNIIPDLLIIDGGKGQLSRVLAVICEIDDPELSAMPIIGLAKGRERIEGNETIIYADANGDFQEINVSLSNSGFKLLLAVRDEAHRFALTGQKAIRKKQNYSKLEDIEGVGTIRRRKLISRFGSLQAVKLATCEQLMQVSGISENLAKKIISELN